MKSFYAEQPQFVAWLVAVGRLTNEGKVMCPLMFEPEHAGHFKAEVCACDIPTTREEFFQSRDQRTCFDKEASTCIPAQELPESVQREHRNTLPLKLRYVRGSWTRHLGKDGPYKPWWAPYNGHRDRP